MSVFWKIFILIGSVIASGSLVLAFRIKSGKTIKLLLSYSGAFILALCLFHLLPEVYEGIADPLVSGWLILGGFLLQLLLDYISGGIEHGHIHPPDQHGHHNHHHHHSHDHSHEDIDFHPVMRSPWLLMTGLCLHALVEGVPLMYGKAGDDLFTAIIFHNIPISVSLMTLFLMSGKTIRQSLLALFIFSLMTPLGALTAVTLFPTESDFTGQFGFYALAVVIGIFLHISTTILFESDEHHRFNIIKLITILLGFATALLIR
ncbi:MAG TPA: ZIP family metal transporter [Flavobacteriales bacterium]|nr:ZIP family metal transporter [Flavobacteriales bacterium]HPH82415.1 ZIP family metal transporter [Flavobacteriales bacterium]